MAIRITLTHMAHGGEAIGRHQGKVVFVPYGLPGEEVEVELVEERRNYARARLLRVIHPSPERVSPPCPHFGPCGGCQLQHARYEAQLRFKEEILRDQLRRIGHIEDPPLRPFIGMPEPWRYRNHIQLHVSASGGEGRLGYLGARSHRVVPIQECPIAHSALEDILRSLQIDFMGLRRVSLRVGTRTDERMVVLEPAGTEVPALEIDEPIDCVLISKEGVPLSLSGDPYLHEEVAGRTYRISANSFFQVNTDQLGALIEIVQRYAQSGGNEVLLDAYSGVGVLGLSLAPRVAQAILIEADPQALSDARANAADLPNVEFIAGPVEEILPAWDRPIDIAILDPPRRGCARGALEALLRIAPTRVIYVACDPATFARDLKLLLANGEYHLVEIQPMDMFPQTYHIEAVALLTRDAHRHRLSRI